MSGFYDAVKHLTPDGFLKWIDRYHFDSRELQALIQNPPRPLHVQAIDLSVARLVSNPLVVTVPGRGFVGYGYVTSSATKTHATGVYVSVRIGEDKPENTFPAKHNRGFRGDFIKLFLSWPAQSDSSMDLVIFQFDDDPWEEDGFVAASAGGGGLANPATLAKGSILIGNPADTIAELAIGSLGQMLAVQSTGLLGYSDYLNMSARAIFFEDFMNLCGNFANYPFAQQNSGGAGVVNSNRGQYATPDHPGILSQQMGTVGAGAYAMVFGSSVDNCFMIGGAGVTTYETSLMLTPLSVAGVNTYDLATGWRSSPWTNDFAPVNAIWFRYSDNINAGNFSLYCTKAGVTTVTDTGIPAVAGTFYRLTWVLNAAGTSVQAYVNGIAAGAACVTNIPLPTVPGGLQLRLAKSLGAANATCSHDYVKYTVEFTTPR